MIKSMSGIFTTLTRLTGWFPGTVNRDGYRILVYAILLSLVWHVFWLSMIKVVVFPSRKETVKFSKVSFLGPILPKVAAELRIEPRQKSLLEERHYVRMGEAAQAKTALAYVKERMDQEVILLDSPDLKYRIDDAVTGRKLEAAYNN